MLRNVHQTIKSRIPAFVYDSLIYLIRQALNITTALIFWVVVTNLYAPPQVGIATATVSTIGTLVIFSKLGLELSLLRFIGNEGIDNRKLINTSLTLIVVVSLLLAGGAIAIHDYWVSVDLVSAFGGGVVLTFVLGTVARSVFAIQDHIYLSVQREDLSVFQGSLVVSQLGLVAFFTHLEWFGILLSWCLGAAVAALGGNVLVKRCFDEYSFGVALSRDIISRIFTYSWINYLGQIFHSLPRLAMPILVFNLLSATSNAAFYIPWMIVNSITIVPSAIGSVLMVRLSDGDNNYGDVAFLSLLISIAIIVPGIIVAAVFGKTLLRIFGDFYARQSYTLLLILLFSAIFISINTLYAFIERSRDNSKSATLMYLFIALTGFGGAVLIAPDYGIVGVGAVWCFVNASWVLLKSPKLIQLFTPESSIRTLLTE